MKNHVLSINNLKYFISSLEIDPQQEKFLLDELPTMNEEERMELLNTLKDVYFLNQEKYEAIKRIKEKWV